MGNLHIKLKLKRSYYCDVFKKIPSWNKIFAQLLKGICAKLENDIEKP